MYQLLVLVGNLGRDPEMRYTPTGTPVTTFSIATSRKWTDASGQPKEETAWFRVSVFGKQAEICNQYLAKGRKVLVEGSLIVDDKTGGPRVYTRKDGTAAASFEVRASTVRFLSPKGENADAGGANLPAPAPVMGGEPMTEEELPF
ncbi:MAG: single-stranded DNA-binding protein [Anaerolineae bacterium]